MGSEVTSDLNFRSQMKGFITTNTLYRINEMTDSDYNSDVFLLDYEERDLENGEANPTESFTDLDCTFKVVKVSQYDLKIKNRSVSAPAGEERGCSGSSRPSTGSSRVNGFIRQENADLGQSPLPDLVSSPEVYGTHEDSEMAFSVFEDVNLIKAHRIPTVAHRRVAVGQRSNHSGTECDEPWLVEVRQWALKVCECFDTPVTFTPHERYRKKKRNKVQQTTEVRQAKSVAQCDTTLIFRSGSEQHSTNVVPAEKDNSLNVFASEGNGRLRSHARKVCPALERRKCFEISYEPGALRSVETFTDHVNGEANGKAFSEEDRVQVNYQDVMPDNITIETLESNEGCSIYLNFERVDEVDSIDSERSSSQSSVVKKNLSKFFFCFK